MKPISFSRKADAGFQVPVIWHHGNCAVEIDVSEVDDEESASFAAIFKRAFDIVVQCVIHTPHFGGTSPIGEDGKLLVRIAPTVSGPSDTE